MDTTSDALDGLRELAALEGLAVLERLSRATFIHKVNDRRRVERFFGRDDAQQRTVALELHLLEGLAVEEAPGDVLSRLCHDDVPRRRLSRRQFLGHEGPLPLQPTDHRRELALEGA